MRAWVAGVLVLVAVAVGSAWLLWRGVPPRCVAVDGDTLRCGEERVRLSAIDAPEMRGRCAREARLARRARDRLDELVSGGVVLRREGRDRYGRTLASATDRRGRDVAEVLMEEGLARPYVRGRGRQSWC